MTNKNRTKDFPAKAVENKYQSLTTALGADYLTTNENQSGNAPEKQIYQLSSSKDEIGEKRNPSLPCPHGNERCHCRGRSADGSPNPVDVHAGYRLRLRRTMLGLSQPQMARKLGLTFQQVQKYERGDNRISGSRLWDISHILNVPMEYFFQDMDEKIKEQSPMMLCAPDKENLPLPFEAADDPMTRTETQELVRGYYKIKNRKIAAMLFQLITMMSRSNSTLPTDEMSIHDKIGDLLEEEDKNLSLAGKGKRHDKV